MPGIMIHQSKGYVQQGGLTLRTLTSQAHIITRSRGWMPPPPNALQKGRHAQTTFHLLSPDQSPPQRWEREAQVRRTRLSDSQEWKKTIWEGQEAGLQGGKWRVDLFGPGRPRCSINILPELREIDSLNHLTLIYSARKIPDCERKLCYSPVKITMIN